jgi:hypothetical protein
MNNFKFDHTDAGFDPALWSKLHEYMRSRSHDCAPQSIHTANDDLQGSNAPHDTASIPVPTTLMATFTQTNYTYPVSKQPLDRRHCLSLPHHRVSRRLGPCRAQVGPILASATILPVHRTQSLLRCKIPRTQAGRRYLLARSLPPCRQFGGCNNQCQCRCHR